MSLKDELAFQYNLPKLGIEIIGLYRHVDHGWALFSRSIASDLDLPKRQILKMLRILRDNSFMELDFVMDEDSTTLGGSGYHLTQWGENILQQLDRRDKFL